MHTATWVLILGLAVPAYAYLGYPILLFIMAALVQMARDVYYLLYRTERRTRGEALPSVTILMAAYNEADVIERTLQNLAELDYPREKLEILVGSDGSTDGTAALVQRWSDRGVRVLDFSERRGKMSVISDCAAEARGDILVLTDANTLMRPDAVRNLVRHFGDPSVGAVCGELRLVAPDGKPAEEGLYWRYEVTLKILENRLNAVLGANGAIYALRRPLFPQLSRDLITDDFVIPMTVRAAGHRVVYDPEAVATEDAPGSVSSEFRRRMRIGAGNWQALARCAALLLPWKGFVSYAFWSHKVLRWATPFLLVAALVANLLLLGSTMGQVILALQAAFYVAAALGFLLPRLRVPAGPLRLPAYFVAINAALAAGLLRGLLRRQRAAWSRTSRQPLAPRRD
jgi:cellulose synthase/poly-beta-1,6-N-acetylglucosamine synthase-like glycosyltransferase